MSTDATRRRFEETNLIQISISAFIVDIHVKFSKLKKDDLMEELPQSRSSVTAASLAVVGRHQSGYSALT
jgi:hypothetical protein